MLQMLQIWWNGIMTLHFPRNVDSAARYDASSNKSYTKSQKELVHVEISYRAKFISFVEHRANCYFAIVVSYTFTVPLAWPARRVRWVFRPFLRWPGVWLSDRLTKGIGMWTRGRGRLTAPQYHQLRQTAWPRRASSTSGLEIGLSVASAGACWRNGGQQSPPYRCTPSTSQTAPLCKPSRSSPRCFRRTSARWRTRHGWWGLSDSWRSTGREGGRQVSPGQVYSATLLVEVLML